MATTLRLEIVTPAGRVYVEDVEMVTLPGVAGQMGIYPHHVPLMTQMVPGEMRSEEHTSELQSHSDLVCRLLLEKKKDEPQDGEVRVNLDYLPEVLLRLLAFAADHHG